uniref:amidase family protein n=1 Tax=Treponema endosymbiont of Eucomonympha sp. TaxID=1580831 RepID=UPI000B2A554C
MTPVSPMTAGAVKAALTEGTTTSEALVREAAERFQADKDAPIPLNAFLEIYDDALDTARQRDAEREAARKAGAFDALWAEKPLHGVPFSVKDNISVKG